MTNLVTIARKGVRPSPVYEATYEDGTKKRMAFWSQTGRPLDVDRGRRHCADTHGARGREVVDGWVVVGGERYQDPAFNPGSVLPGANTKKARKPSAAVLLKLLARVLDGDAKAIAEARGLVAP